MASEMIRLLGAVFGGFFMGAVLGLILVGVVKWIFRVANPKAWIVAGVVGAAVPAFFVQFADRTPLEVLPVEVGCLLAAVWFYRRYSKAKKQGETSGS